MIEIHDSDLIEFFGAAPEAEPHDEREFFAAPLFIKRVDGLELRVSISAHFRDLRLDLRKIGQEAVVFELVVPGIRAVGVARGRQHRVTTPFEPSLRVTGTEDRRNRQGELQ